MRTVPLRLTRSIVRVGALAEAFLGIAALVVPRPVTAALVAFSYAAFAVVVAVRLATRRSPRYLWLLRPARHAAHRGAPAARPRAGRRGGRRRGRRAPTSGTLVTQLTHQPWAGFPLLFVSAVALWLTLLALSALASLEGAAPPRAPWAESGGGPVSLSTSLVTRTARALEGRLSRRSLINRSAFVGSAVAIGSGLDLALRPGTAYGAICECGNAGCGCGSTCCSGFSEFCCAVSGVQLLPREHHHGRLVGGRGLLLLQRPPLLHGLQRDLRVRRRMLRAASPSASRSATASTAAAARRAATPT